MGIFFSNGQVMKNSLLWMFILCALLTSNGCSRASNPAPLARRFTTIRVDPRTERIELFLRDDAGRPFKNFAQLKSWLGGRNRELRFAMNAGMFQQDLSPVGLFVQEGKQISRLNLLGGTGNFYLKPNGVFFVTEAGPRIVESTEYPGLARDVRLATQSGPLLVRKGVLHPSIKADSTSRLVRNGVGISGNTIIFVISEEPVNFYELAVYFRDELHCPDALYLDGVVSSLYSTELQRNDSRADLGPMVAVVK